MRFAFTEEQRALRAAVREFFEKECRPEQVRAAAMGWSQQRWKALAGLGVTGLLAAEQEGGLGLDETDLVLLLEESGRAALPEPILETAAIAVPLLRGAPGPLREHWLGRLARGEAMATACLSPDRFAPGAEAAGLFVLQSGDELHAVPRDAVTLVAERSLDATRPLFSVEWSPSRATVAAGGDTAAAMFDRGVMGAAAQLLGIGGRLVEMAAAYAKDRHQFGRPIGAFQAVKHHLANAFVAVEFARPLVYRAAMSVASGDAQRARDVSMAKAFASDAAELACKVALQVHGAIGYTEEHDVHLWLKRGWSLAASWGSAAWHRERVAGVVL